MELAPIRANCVRPGLILTEVWEGVAPDRLSRMTGRQPLPRPGTPAEFAEACVHLMRRLHDGPDSACVRWRDSRVNRRPGRAMFHFGKARLDVLT